MLDAIGLERQFIDHLAPLWRALPTSIRGRFLTDLSLMDHARELGITAEPIDAHRIRWQNGPPKANPRPGPAALTVSVGDIKVGRRLGYTRFAFMEHGAGQAYIGERRPEVSRHPSYAGGDDREDVELFLCPNEYSARLWRDRYPAARVEIVGAPRLDDLPRREPGPQTIAISFHWPAHISQEADTALGHYLPVLSALAKAFTVIGHAHPKGDWPRRMERIYRRAGIEFVADFAEVCRRADLYAVDNSSTLFEFAATGRPVVVLNCPSYRKAVNHGLRFWDAAEVGIQVDKPADLIPAVTEALGDPLERQVAREAALSIVYAYRTGAAARAATAIAEWAGVRAEVAA